MSARPSLVVSVSRHVDENHQIGCRSNFLGDSPSVQDKPDDLLSHLDQGLGGIDLRDELRTQEWLHGVDIEQNLGPLPGALP